MQDLIERLEKATGPDRQLDGLIGRSLETLPTEPFKNEAPFDRLAGMYWVLGRKDSESGPNEERWGKCPPLYTASIDAALTLVPLSDGKATHWGVELDRGFEAHVSRNNVKSGHWLQEGYGSTPAIALCIAALKARANG